MTEIKKPTVQCLGVRGSTLENRAFIAAAAGFREGSKPTVTLELMTPPSEVAQRTKYKGLVWPGYWSTQALDRIAGFASQDVVSVFVDVETEEHIEFIRQQGILIDLGDFDGKLTLDAAYEILDGLSL